MTQVNRMTSGAPLNIWVAPTKAAFATSVRPPREAFSTSRSTHGIHPSAEILFGQIRKLSARPLKQKEIPARPAASRLEVQRKARKYIPIPARNRWNRTNHPSDHGNGSSR